MFQECTTTGVWMDGAAGPRAVYFNSNVPAEVAAFPPHQGAYAHPFNRWTRVDVMQYGVPADAKAVFLKGIQIISMGYAQEQADMHIAFRSDASNSSAGQIFVSQACETTPISGIRSDLAAFVPLKDGGFEIGWYASTVAAGTWPAHAAYGLRLHIQAYFR